MSFNRPTVEELIERIQADIEARLPGTDPRLRRSVLDIISRTLAGSVHGLYGYLDHIAEQIIIDTAELEYLERHASNYGISRKAATQAVGSVTFTGSNGSTIPAGTTVQRADGEEFTTDALGTIASGSALVAVTAVNGGDGGNTDAASTVSLTSSLSGINTVATVDANALIGGADTETDDALRARLLTRIQRPPHGGTQADYEQWTLEVPGVTRAWCQPETPAVGQATILFAMEDADPIPDAGEVTALQTYIDGLKPVTADIIVSAPVIDTVNFTIALVPAGDATVQAAIQAELEDLVLRKGEPGGTLYISHIREAISRAAGEENHTMSVPAADVVIASTDLAVFGAITWS